MRGEERGVRGDVDAVFMYKVLRNIKINLKVSMVMIPRDNAVVAVMRENTNVFRAQVFHSCFLNSIQWEQYSVFWCHSYTYVYMYICIYVYVSVCA